MFKVLTQGKLSGKFLSMKIIATLGCGSDYYRAAVLFTMKIIVTLGCGSDYYRAAVLYANENYCYSGLRFRFL